MSTTASVMWKMFCTIIRTIILELKIRLWQNLHLLFTSTSQIQMSLCDQTFSSARTFKCFLIVLVGNYLNWERLQLLLNCTDKCCLLQIIIKKGKCIVSSLKVLLFLCSYCWSLKVYQEFAMKCYSNSRILVTCKITSMTYSTDSLLLLKTQY